MDSRNLLYRVTSAATTPLYGASASTWDAQRVRALRLHLRLTQAEFSQRLGTRQQHVSEWERGKHRPRGISITMLDRLAQESGFAQRRGTH